MISSALESYYDVRPIDTTIQPFEISRLAAKPAPVVAFDQISNSHESLKQVEGDDQHSPEGIALGALRQLFILNTLQGSAQAQLYNCSSVDLTNQNIGDILLGLHWLESLSGGRLLRNLESIFIAPRESMPDDDPARSIPNAFVINERMLSVEPKPFTNPMQRDERFSRREASVFRRNVDSKSTPDEDEIGISALERVLNCRPRAAVQSLRDAVVHEAGHILNEPEMWSSACSYDPLGFINQVKYSLGPTFYSETSLCERLPEVATALSRSDTMRDRVDWIHRKAFREYMQHLNPTGQILEHFIVCREVEPSSVFKMAIV
jgi:hypothetical protein